MRGQTFLAGRLPPVIKTARAVSRLLTNARREESVRSMIEEASREKSIAFIAPSRTLVDVGEWFRRGRVWLAIAGEEVVLAASGRRPFIEKAPVTAVAESFYNQITGELVFRPKGVFSVESVKIQPAEAYKVMSVARMKTRRSDHA